MQGWWFIGYPGRELFSAIFFFFQKTLTAKTKNIIITTHVFSLGRERNLSIFLILHLDIDKPKKNCYNFFRHAMRLTFLFFQPMVVFYRSPIFNFVLPSTEC